MIFCAEFAVRGANVACDVARNDCLKEYFETRNGMIGPDYSTKVLLRNECHRTISPVQTVPGT